MAITDTEKIDFISIRNTDRVILTISDHLNWEDSNFHLATLQTKLNAYIAFIESGEIFKVYPDANGKSISIDIISEYNFPKEGILFLEKVIPVLKSIGVELKQETIIER